MRVLRVLLLAEAPRFLGERARLRTSVQMNSRTATSASSAVRVESVRMYVMRPIVPLSPIVLPS